ncbi:MULTISPECIES: GNAT family N-acetyltransferase [unclassified Streptomyces]|uniref:GNAT family N-acetyltransferase n=1 Tax=unclassified Streptomyces TaxID=2593676 RepID=UPI00037EC07C|nr:GNAT family N-acetyltransferase [Streptomyces sp. BoleA5]MYX33221.1 GNAT family N-acetyltransferase [Streptomyces sp. SID8377]
MKAPTTRPFEASDVDGAAGLLAARHRRDRAGEAALDPGFAEPAVCAALLRDAWERGARGAVAETADGALAGYLIAVPGDDVRGRHVWTGPGHYATHDGDVLRGLYADLSGPWLGEGRLHHYAVAAAHDLPVWLSQCFAYEQVHAVTDLTAGAAGFHDDVRAARPSDLAALEPLFRLVADAHTAPPVFAFIEPSFHEGLRPGHLELLEDPAVSYWLAEGPEGVRGFCVMRPVPDDEVSLTAPRGSVELLLAATAPGYRGGGVGRRLTEHALADAARNGFRVCVTDWRAANPLSSAFWPRRGFRPVAHRLHRLLDPRLSRG